MSAHRNDPQEYLVYNSSSLVSYFDCTSDELVSVQVTKTTTGSLTSARLESSNYYVASGQGPRTGSGDNGLWYEQPGPHSATLLLTASTTQASAGAEIGNVASRYLKLTLGVGAGDVFRIVWHGKGSGR